MLDTSSTTGAAMPTTGDKTELSAQDVLHWLRTKGYHGTHETLKSEASHHSNVTEQAVTPVPCATPNDLQLQLRDSVEEALSAYRQLSGSDESVYALLDHWSPSLLSNYHLRRSMGGPGNEKSTLEKQMEELEEANRQLRSRERELEAQVKQTVVVVAERLQALVASIDPMRKDILLPLLRTVAVLGSSSTVRAAARHAMLSLYKRPMMEQRMAVVQEWLRIAREATPRTLEQELIPELYTLVNAPVFERRLLALDCTAAVAPLLRRSPQVRYSLCQGLLRPLCEDDTSAVRRELPRCLSLMWGDTTPGGPAATQGSLHHQTPPAVAAAPPSTFRVPLIADRAVAAASSPSAVPIPSGDTPDISPLSLSPSQQSFLMELLVHLAIDTSSRSVRQAAQTQLCEVLYPVFLRDGVLLAQFVPLLLTVIGMESTQLLLQRRRPNRGSAGNKSTTVANTANHTADEPPATVAAALSLNNVMTLVQLLHAALRCVAAEVLHARDTEDRRGEQVAQVPALSTTCVNVVLPAAYTLLVPLLSKVQQPSRLAAAEAGRSASTGDGEGAPDPCTQLRGPLCALCATLASLVPVLGAAAWEGVWQYLTSSFSPAGMTAATRDTAAAAINAVAQPPSSATFPSHGLRVVGPDSIPASPESAQELCQGRLLFTYSFFLLLCGDAVSVPTAVEHAQKTADETPSPTASPHSAHSVRRLAKRIHEESCTLMAEHVCLASEDLSGPVSAGLTLCVQCIACLAPFAMESHEVASGIASFLRFLVASSEVRRRLTAVVLAHDTCAVLTNERLKVTLLIEPTLPLLEDMQPQVQEAAVRGTLAIAASLAEPRAQERAIRPVLRVAEAAGCTSRFTHCMLLQWDQLMPRMPAEPREALLYPQLAVLMDRLAEQYVERISCEGMPPPAAAASALPRTQSNNTVHDGTGANATATSSQALLQRLPSLITPAAPNYDTFHAWETTLLTLHGLLHSILRSAVVTPTLVSRYLLPGIQQLASEGVMSACSPAVRTKWLRLLKGYLAFMESNASRYTSTTGTPGAGTLLDRVKDELKRRL